MTMSIPEAATLADTLDCLGAGLFLLDATGRIVHANASAHALLRQRTVVSVLDGKLVACDGRAAQALKEIVAEAGTGGALALPLRAPDGEHCIAHVLQLASGARPRASAGEAAIALLVHKVALDFRSPPAAIAGLYGLTPSEVRVLLAIVDVGGVRETAEALGIAEATVKTHLHRLFGKTGATRQAELVKLVAGFASPVVGRSGSLPCAVNRTVDAAEPDDWYPRRSKNRPTRPGRFASLAAVS
jgi:DNA-binding CsgD family transcriptional regulator